MDWDSINLNTLDRLRATFLAGRPPEENYWRKWDDLANYDFVFARRIGWKWDAVLSDLKRLGWSPPAGVLLDWGCGTGIATRRFLEHYGPATFREIRVHDRSNIAKRFAAETIRRETARLKVSAATDEILNSRKPIGLLLISHVLNELSEEDRTRLLKLCQRSKAVIWVEPGSHDESRDLIEFREQLRGDFRVIAPCTHTGRCELLTSSNERHWCHFFAEPPAEILRDHRWSNFARDMKIDLRSLPYSYLVVQHRKVKSATDLLDLSSLTRVVGRPRVYKPMAKVFCCDERGLIDREAQKRDAPDLYRACRKKELGNLCELTLNGERILSTKDPFV
jgi:ribosomal protein RSM22 (predicted rRNA methylase)